MSELLDSHKLNSTRRTHSDTTLAMLRRGGGVDLKEEKVLGPWNWSENEAVLHWDERVSQTTRELGSIDGVSAPAHTAESLFG